MTDLSGRTMVVLERDAAVTNTLAKGTAPVDLGGSVGTTRLTDEMIRCVVHMLDFGEPLA